MFLFDWINAFLNWLGFLKNEGSLIIVGLGNAGKTTFLSIISHDILKAHMPTLRPHQDSFTLKNIHFNAWDLGGQQNLRKLWRDYVTTDSNDIVIFVVDSNDRDLLGEAKSELHDVLQYSGSRPVLIIGSKQDIKSCMTRDELIQGLDIGDYVTGLTTAPKIVDVLVCSNVTRRGLPQIMNWITKCFEIAYIK
ncbi:ARF/SAR superfamily protein [Cavenderia fasciculata]|uniref:ARF/SAR superfamily protein n=1 Tax=Cavenderia fasciculata TaxID=261658 RepID=F4Q7D0_CACFS|nr:ARF/SAR superfamily protein [Cavenderia fasciculata]EGG16312.1 ARF/SAR superfamily protein [Cavenderia fasciculata]|eukprot:XP_004354696.1 ARF/SAR superfamily protein [Cavenderia fasciculata]